MTLSATVALFYFSCLEIECTLRHSASLSRLAERYFLLSPRLMYLMEIVWQWQLWSPEFHTVCLCRRDAFRLTDADILALVLCHKGQDLQHDITDECAEEVFSVAGIEQGHIQHHNIDLFLFRQNAPLFLYLFIVPAEAVDALDVEQIAFFQLSEQFLVGRTVEILSRLLINIQIPLGNLPLFQCRKLSRRVLVTG